MRLFSFNDVGARCVLPDALDAVQAGFLCLVAFTGGDDLSVFRFEAEAGLAGLVGVNFEFWMLLGSIPFNRLVLDSSDRSIYLNAVDSREAAFLGLVDLTAGNDLSVRRLKVKNISTRFTLFQSVSVQIFP